MKERTFNLFLFITNDIITELGAVVHEQTGSDDAKLAILCGRARADWKTCQRYPVPERYVVVQDGKATKWRLSYEGYLQLQTHSLQMDVLEDVFHKLGALGDPLFVLTPIVDGVPKLEGRGDHTPASAQAALAGPGYESN